MKKDQIDMRMGFYVCISVMCLIYCMDNFINSIVYKNKIEPRIELRNLHELR